MRDDLSVSMRPLSTPLDKRRLKQVYYNIAYGRSIHGRLSYKTVIIG